MNEEILIESKPALLDFEHLYLVFRDDDGSETVIRGGPEFDNPLNFGNIVLEVDIPINQSRDIRQEDDNTLTPEDRNSRQINLGGRDATAVWEIMRQQATNIHNANLDYNVAAFAQNSNSTVVSVLNSVGLDLDDNLPVNKTRNDFPGAENFLDFATNLEGTEANDVIQGYDNDDTLAGGAGNDSINGGSGNDYVNAGNGRDTVEGDLGQDRFYGVNGTDFLYGEDDRDSLFGGNDHDFLYAGNGNGLLVIAINRHK